MAGEKDKKEKESERQDDADGEEQRHESGEKGRGEGQQGGRERHGNPRGEERRDEPKSREQPPRPQSREPSIFELSGSAFARAITYAKCDCGFLYKAAEGECPKCTRKCAECGQVYPKTQPCPVCSAPVDYKISAVPDFDEQHNRWELSVVFLKIVGNKHPIGVPARVRLLDPARPTGEFDLGEHSMVIHAPSTPDKREVYFVLVSTGEPVACVVTDPIPLEGHPVRFSRVKPRFTNNPADSFRRSLEG